LKNISRLAVILLFSTGCLLALSVNGRNSFEFRLAGSSESDDFFENRFDLRASESFVTLGARVEAMHPSRSSAITRPGEEYDEITHLWAKASLEKIEITAGTIMESFGNGLILDARERSEIQEDRHIDGVSLDLKLPSSSLSLLVGVADWNSIDNFTIKGLDYCTQELPYLNLGAGYLSFENKVAEDFAVLPDQVGEIVAARVMPEVGPFFGEFQYSKMWRDNSAGGGFTSGDIYYGNASFNVGPIVVFGEFLQADSFSARGYGDKSWLVALPLIVHQPSYTLMSRHLEEINPLNSRAIGGEASYSFERGDVTVSAASVGEIEGDDNPYFELYGSTYLDFERYSLRFVGEYQDLSGEDEAYNFVIEPLFYITERASILFDFELQTGVEFGEDMTNLYGLTEFTLSPYGSIGVEGGRIGAEAEYFARAYVDFALGENNKVTLAYGKRPGGFTCSGGSCRFEPEFEGFEFKLVTTF